MQNPVLAQRRHDAGLTLIETMVALSLIAIMAGIVVSGASVGSTERVLEAEANKLAQKLNYAADEALVGGYPVELKWSPTGYAFSISPDRSAMVILPQNLAPPLFAQSKLPKSVTLIESEGAASLTIPPGLDGAPIVLIFQSGEKKRFVLFDGYSARMLREEPGQT